MKQKCQGIESGLEYIMNLKTARTNKENLSLAKQEQNPLTVENGRNCEHHFLQPPVAKETRGWRKNLSSATLLIAWDQIVSLGVLQGSSLAQSECAMSYLSETKKLACCSQ